MKPLNTFSITFWHPRVSLLILALFIMDMGEPLLGFEMKLRIKSANELEFTIAPVMPEKNFEISAKTNGLSGQWTLLAAVLATTNTTETFIYRFAESSLSSLRGFEPKNISNFVFVVSSGDSDGDGLWDGYEDLVSRTDPLESDTGDLGIPDGYRDSDGDNWLNLDELRNTTDPSVWDSPGPPAGVGLSFNTNGTAALTWSHLGPTPPNYFLIERADRTWKMPSPTNNPSRPNRLKPVEPSMVQGDYYQVARVLPKRDSDNYTYVATNLGSTLAYPLFRVRSHYTAPVVRVPKVITSNTVHGTIMELTSRRTSSGYDLDVSRSVPNARYLLLSRDTDNKQWRASGYFSGNTARLKIPLQVDERGMMKGTNQSPTVLPNLQHFKKPSSEITFIAGSGEDSDKDGLPDIYEVLVTSTDAAKTSTAKSGTPDGYADVDGDGWSNIEEFLRRTNPLKPDAMPSVIELERPTAEEFMRAFHRPYPSDLSMHSTVHLRTTGETEFKPAALDFWLNQKPGKDERLDFDVRFVPVPSGRSMGSVLLNQ